MWLHCIWYRIKLGPKLIRSLHILVAGSLDKGVARTKGGGKIGCHKRSIDHPRLSANHTNIVKFRRTTNCPLATAAAWTKAAGYRVRHPVSNAGGTGVGGFHKDWWGTGGAQRMSCCGGRGRGKVLHKGWGGDTVRASVQCHIFCVTCFYSSRSFGGVRGVLGRSRAQLCGRASNVQTEVGGTTAHESSKKHLSYLPQRIGRILIVHFRRAAAAHR